MGYSSMMCACACLWEIGREGDIHNRDRGKKEKKRINKKIAIIEVPLSRQHYHFYHLNNNVLGFHVLHIHDFHKLYLLSTRLCVVYICVLGDLFTILFGNGMATLVFTSILKLHLHYQNVNLFSIGDNEFKPLAVPWETIYIGNLFQS